MSLRKFLTIITITALCCGPCWVLAQAQDDVVGPVYGTAVRHDLSRPLRDMALPAPGPDTGVQIEIPMHVPPQRQRPANVPGAPDAARQDQARMPGALAPTPQPSLNFDGLSDDDNAAVVGFRIAPPDTNGDIGRNHYVQWINLIYAVYDKTTGARIFGPVAGNTIWSGFGGVCETNNDGDPIALYDHMADRWVLSQFAINFGTQCVAVSQTPDPTGAYYRWAFQVTPGGNNDYPKLGVMPESYFLSLRDFPSSPTFAGAVAFDRRAMLRGEAGARFVKFSLTCGVDCVDGFQPPHLEGPPPASGAPGIFSKAWDDDFDGPVTGTDGYRLWRFEVDWSVAGPNPPSSFTELPIVPTGAPFDNNMCGFFNRNCVPQASSATRLDPIDELQMYRAQYRSFPGYDALILNTTVDATGGDVAGVRWAELRNTGAGWTLHQEGTYAPADGLNRWMGSMAQDGDGNAALGYSASSSTSDPSIRYTSRMAGDPLGTLPGGEVVMQAGGGAQTSPNRWGDYSSMSVDPVDDCTFWYTQEYYANSGSFDFATRIGSFILAGCNTNRCGNGFCQPGESCDGSGGTVACPADCDIPGGGGTAVCGNGVCEAGDGENCMTCAADCNGRTNGRPANRFCCGFGDGFTPDGCGDSRCTTGGFSCTEVPVPGGGGTLCCGDGICDASGDECGACDLDCGGSSVCAGGGGSCVPTSNKEKGPRCSDGIDNDCDGLIDGADPDC